MSKTPRETTKEPALRPTHSSRRVSRRQAVLSRRPGRIFNPRTKAEWLVEQFAPEDPTFPLDAEIVAAIPKSLPGEVPSNPTELYTDEPQLRRRGPRRARHQQH